VSRHSSWSSCETMGSLPPPSPSRLRPRSRDTGFPSSFDGRKSSPNLLPIPSYSQIIERNTTLPHPDADLSPNASISADDIAIGRVISRQRRSFMAKHKRTVSHGMITPEMERTHSDNLVLLREENEPPMSAVDSKRSQQTRSSNHDGASLASSNDSGGHLQADGSDTSPTSDRSFEGPAHGTGLHGHKRRRSSFLKRLMHR
jgi:hypothetical protein